MPYFDLAILGLGLCTFWMMILTTREVFPAAPHWLTVTIGLALSVGTMAIGVYLAELF